LKKAPELPVEAGLHRRTHILTNILLHGEIYLEIRRWGNMVVEVPFSSRYLGETSLKLG
jgi:hypothetical protein